MDEEMDFFLSRSLKNWAAKFSPPKEARERLLQRASQTAHPQKRWFVRLLELIQPRPFEPYAFIYNGAEWVIAPRTHMQLWVFHMATGWRLAN